MRQRCAMQRRLECIQRAAQRNTCVRKALQMRPAACHQSGSISYYDIRTGRVDDDGASRAVAPVAEAPPLRIIPERGRGRPPSAVARTMALGDPAGSALPPKSARRPGVVGPTPAGEEGLELLELLEHIVLVGTSEARPLEDRHAHRRFPQNLVSLERGRWCNGPTIGGRRFRAMPSRGPPSWRWCANEQDAQKKGDSGA